MSDTSIQQDKLLSDFGKKFYKATFETVFDSACNKCGNLRKVGKTSYSFDSDQYCANCGNAYGHLEKKVIEVYVISIYEMFNGERGYQLSTTSPDEYENNLHNGMGISYWSHKLSQLGEDYFETEEEVMHE